MTQPHHEPHIEVIDGGYALTVNDRVWHLIGQWAVVEPASGQVITICSTVEHAIDLLAGVPTH